jgi:F0F1-type ATP synthase alpha subunit
METITTKRAKKPYLTSLEPKKIVEFEQDYLLYLRSQLVKPTLLKSLKGSIVVDEEHDETFDQAFQAYLKELGIK